MLGFKSGEAGILLLVGQVADALATPFIGYHSDKDQQWWIYRFGKRKVWYFVGTICVLVTFPFIFSPCIRCRTASIRNQMIYYSVFIVIFQFGWAAVQIAHMSLIPEITSNAQQRTKLAAARNGATVVSSVLVYLVTWGVLQTSGGSDSKIDAAAFQHIVWAVMAFGIVCSVLFYIMVKEPLASKAGHEETSNSISPISFKTIFLDPNLYLVGLVYMASRLFINLTQVFISLYLSESLDMAASSLALVPLAMYIASFVASIPVGPITNLAGRRVTFLVGAILGVCGCFWIHWGQGNDFRTYYIFVVSALLGAASTIVLVSSLDITTSLIGSKTSRGAFIYGIMSFADKLSNGVAVKVIQDVHNDEENAEFYRDVITYVCGGVLIVGAAVVCMVKNRETKDRPGSKASISTIS